MNSVHYSQALCCVSVCTQKCDSRKRLRSPRPTDAQTTPEQAENKRSENAPSEAHSVTAPSECKVPHLYTSSSEEDEEAEDQVPRAVHADSAGNARGPPRQQHDPDTAKKAVRAPPSQQHEEAEDSWHRQIRTPPPMSSGDEDEEDMKKRLAIMVSRGRTVSRDNAPRDADDDNYAFVDEHIEAVHFERPCRPLYNDHQWCWLHAVLILLCCNPSVRCLVDTMCRRLPKAYTKREAVENNLIRSLQRVFIMLTDKSQGRRGVRIKSFHAFCRHLAKLIFGDKADNVYDVNDANEGYMRYLVNPIDNVLVRMLHSDESVRIYHGALWHRHFETIHGGDNQVIRRNHTEFSMSLTMRIANSNSLAEAFDNASPDVHVYDRNGHGRCTRSMRFCFLPHQMTLFVDRVNPATGQMSNKRWSFAAEINVNHNVFLSGETTPYRDNGPFVYKLKAFVVYRPPKPNVRGGHYFTMVATPNRDGWLEFNDNRITQHPWSSMSHYFGQFSERGGAVMLYYSMPAANTRTLTWVSPHDSAGDCWSSQLPLLPVDNGGVCANNSAAQPAMNLPHNGGVCADNSAAQPAMNVPHNGGVSGHAVAMAMRNLRICGPSRALDNYGDAQSPHFYMRTDASGNQQFRLVTESGVPPIQSDWMAFAEVRLCNVDNVLHGIQFESLQGHCVLPKRTSVYVEFADDDDFKVVFQKMMIVCRGGILTPWMYDLQHTQCVQRMIDVVCDAWDNGTDAYHCLSASGDIARNYRNQIAALLKNKMGCVKVCTKTGTPKARWEQVIAVSREIHHTIFELKMLRSRLQKEQERAQLWRPWLNAGGHGNVIMCTKHWKERQMELKIIAEFVKHAEEWLRFVYTKVCTAAISMRVC